MKRKSLADIPSIATRPAEHGALAAPGDSRARRVIPMMVAEIRVPDRRRRVDPDQVQVIAESMSQIGLQSPVAVRLDPADAVRCELVAGAHRLAAARQLGWPKIDALVVDGTSDELALMEIDENLARAELTPLDRALFLAERREISNRENPAPRRGRPRQSGVSKNSANFAPISFAEEAGGLTGLSRRGVYRALEIASGLDRDLAEALQGTPLAEREGDLHRLSRLDVCEQRRVLERVRDADSPPGKFADVVDSPLPRPEKAGAARDTLVRAWERCGEEDRRWFLERIRKQSQLGEG